MLGSSLRVLSPSESSELVLLTLVATPGYVADSV